MARVMARFGAEEERELSPRELMDAIEARGIPAGGPVNSRGRVNRKRAKRLRAWLTGDKQCRGGWRAITGLVEKMRLGGYGPDGRAIQGADDAFFARVEAPLTDAEFRAEVERTDG